VPNDGWVQSALRVLDDAPNQRDGAPWAWIRFDEQVAEGAKDLRPGDEIVVLTWLHLSSRDELSTHPEDDMSQPLTGVFSTCSPNRPNRIGLHRARIVARDGLRIEVDALEAIDRTPVVDVKPTIFRGTAGLLAACGCPRERPRRYSQAATRPDQACCFFLPAMSWAIEVFSPSPGMITHAAR
jgi:tRNA (Thr-GGU) A37 N-methylase